MELLIIALWVLLAASFCEALYGIYKRSGILAATGILVALMCILGLILATGYSDSIVITGEGLPV